MEQNSDGKQAAIAGWRQGENGLVRRIPFAFDPASNFPQDIKDAIIAGMQEWNSVFTARGLGLRFEPPQTGDNVGEDGVLYKIGAVGTGPGQVPANAAAKNGLVYDGVTMETYSSVVTFGFSNNQYWDPGVNNPTIRTEFLDAVKIATMHELLHPMGRTDVPHNPAMPPCGGQTPGASIMNGICNVNNRPIDGKRNLPSSLTPCDKASARVVNPEPGSPGPECDAGEPCQTGCPDPYCGSGPPPGPGPSWCNPDLEFWAINNDVCSSICHPTQSYAPDSYNECLGAWTSEVCYYGTFGDWCHQWYGPYNEFLLDGGAGGTQQMWSHSAVRQCVGWDWWSPTYKRTSTECLTHCEANGADACEWQASTGDCYVEFGTGCQVEYGYYGWSAYVFGPGGGSSGGSGTMTSQTGVTCSNWWWHSPVYKASAEECGTHCQANGADACEWHEGSGDCYVEFGTDCSLVGAGGWWAAVFNTQRAHAPWIDRINRIVGGLDYRRLVDPRGFALLILAVAGLLSLGLIGIVTGSIRRPARVSA